MNRLTSWERLYRLYDPEPALDLETNVDVIAEMRRIGNVIVLCALKYHCTPEDIKERMEIILARALQREKDKLATFQENRCGSVSRHVAGA